MKFICNAYVDANCSYSAAGKMRKNVLSFESNEDHTLYTLQLK